MSIPLRGYEKLALQALEAYDLPQYNLHYLAHSDNVTFRVELPAESGDCLLRIHQPVSRTMGAHGADPDNVRSELLWLEALNQDTCLVLQTPLRNRRGELVTQLTAADGQSKLNASLLTWLEGEPYRLPHETSDTAHQLGTLLARLHQHASSWQPPPGFTRPERDRAYFEGCLRTLRTAAEDGRIAPGDFAEFEQAVALLVSRMAGMDRSRHSFGVIHADCHKGNLLIHMGQLRLIDFSFTAYGPYMFDLSVAMSDMKPEFHAAFLAGYTSLQTLPPEHAWWIEGLFVSSMVGTLSYWIDNPSAQEILVRKAPQVARQFAHPFNCGERFWFKERTID